MAWTVTEIAKTVHGNKNVRIVEYTADSAASEAQPGLDVIDIALLCPISMATNGISMKLNVLSGATASNGSISFKSAAANDRFRVLYEGR
jgi:hypothetical protein